MQPFGKNPETHESAAASGKAHWWRRLLLLAVLLFLSWQLWMFGHIVLYRLGYNPHGTAFMRSHLEQMHAKKPDARLQHAWVAYEHISPFLKRAVVASEDAQFVDHHGFDWEGMQSAMEKDVKKGRIVAGGSTITQQLAKNLFLSGQRSPLRKAQEAIITVELEWLLSKRRILEIYLNVVEWGDGVYGAEAAARHYFNIPASQLSQSQAARLAVLLPNPGYYDEHGITPFIEQRQAVIEQRMLQVRIPK
jgi:monofunctional glycosyltransferase